MYEHKNWIYSWFSKKYWLDILVYFEEYDSILEAINREKFLKWINRDKKIKSITKENPNWDDLLLEF